MKVLIIAALIIVAGCCKPMTNSEVIREADKCKEAGYGYHIIKGCCDGKIPVKVICE